MARVALVDERSAPLTARRHFSDGDPGPIVGALASVPEVLEVTLPFLGTVLGPTALDARTKEIVILRTSARLSCRYCVDTHTPVARDAGLTVGEVTALRGAQDARDAFDDPADRALIAWTDAVAGGADPPGDEALDSLLASFDEPAVVELTLLVGATLMLNRFATSLGLPTSPATLERLASEGFA
jgi:AhpD family alkylhydroperoxidase